MDEIHCFNDFYLDVFRTILYFLYIIFTKHMLTFSWLCIDREAYMPFYRNL